MKDYERTIELLGKIVHIRLTEHGDDFDGVLVPLLRIASFQRVLERDDCVVETCRKGLEHANLCLKNEDNMDNEQVRSSVQKFLLEFYQMLYH